MNTLIADLHAALIKMEPADRLRVLHLLPATLDAAMQSTVAELRADGMSWQAIGDILGVSRQTVHERFATR